MASYTISDNTAEVISQRDASQRWLEDSYYPQWERVIGNYKCIGTIRKDADDKPDPDRTHIALPDLFAGVNRRVARITANIPDVHFTAFERDDKREMRISRKVMRDWDAGGVQRAQKKHCRQAELFGWSVRGWWWVVDEFERKRGIDISNPAAISPQDLEAIGKTFGVSPELLINPGTQMAVMSKLAEKYTRRGLLDVRYTYKAYEGARQEVLFIGDVFPAPFFQTLQTAQYFIVHRRRDEDYLNALAKRFPEMAPGVAKLLEEYPRGTPAGYSPNRTAENLRNNMLAVMNRATPSDVYPVEEYSKGSIRREWNIIERWVGGADARVSMVGEECIWLGTISPYNLDGQIPFTDLILLDDPLGGIGDSMGRVGEGLWDMHNLIVNHRFDLLRAVTHPLFFTSDRSLWDNWKVLRRDLGRFVFARGGPNSVWSPVDSSSLAAMQAATSEEASIMRMIQMLMGDSNLSMAAQVDPAQMRTATGARLLQANQDVVTKDMIDQFNYSVTADANMIYLLNRSEMAEPVSFNATHYERNYTAQSDRTKSEWIAAQPVDFQCDGMVTVRLGSTLADDDEAQVGKATNMIQILGGNPLVNQGYVIQQFLIANGEGPNLAKWMAPDQPMPPPEPPVKGSLSITVPFEALSDEQRTAALAVAGIPPAPDPTAPPPGMPPGGPASGPPSPPAMGPANGGPPMSVPAVPPGAGDPMSGGPPQ